MKALLLGTVLLGVGILGCVTSISPADTSRELTRRILRLEGECNTVCSAVPIAHQGNYTWFLTARHCLPARSIGGQATVKTIPHPRLDLALVKAGGKAPLIKISTKAVRPGDKLRIAGWHLGFLMAVTDGRAALEPGFAACLVVFGVSGGAVVNEDGFLVGIFVQLYKGRKGNVLFFATHLARYVVLDKPVRQWIRENIK